MPQPIKLKGDFDRRLKFAFDTYDKVMGRIEMENARPTVWSKKQAEDLRLIRDCLDHILNCLSEFAGAARDD
jgi:hypothetical protein